MNPSAQFRKAESLMSEVQAQICNAIETFEPKKKFIKSSWDRAEGGGGLTTVIEDGDVIERGGVNVSSVFGPFNAQMAQRLQVSAKEFFACGISLIFHPRNPFAPTVHMNYRYFELDSGDNWFGGGCDLTPYYPFVEDAVHFHTVLRDCCQRHPVADYQKFKEECDRYFFLPHRNETRGIGGIFFDYMRGDFEERFAFVSDAAHHFIDGYKPILLKRKDTPFGEQERWWQSIRHGRYVEFNLLYDRGTKFGLDSNGRTESILVSMPRHVSWGYEVTATPGSAEAKLQEFLVPRNWL